MTTGNIAEAVPLLSISIPTYNRPDELKDLVESFINPLLDQCSPKLVDVTIYDNSDPDISKLNRSILNNNISYHSNISNIGFARNVSQCIHKAKGRYVWILPDNDYVFIDKFLSALRLLAKNQDNIDCLFLNWITKYHSGIEKARQVNLPDRPFQFKEYFVYQQAPPFVLLSHAFVSKKLIPCHPSSLIDPSGTNSFRQILEYLPMLNAESYCLSYAEPIMAYNVEYAGRFNAHNLYLSIEAVRRYLLTRKDLASRSFLVRMQQSEYRSYIGHILLASSKLYRQKLEPFVLFRALKLFPRSSISDCKLYILLLCSFLPLPLRTPIANLYARRRASF